jgi:predicted dithiol-disulfide oxidoreductase (DUF899 family)
VKARTELLVKEKKFTRLRDELSAQRRELPWEPVDKEYVFEEAGGKRTLAEVFDGRSQLIVYHFMFDPDWDEGCPHCSFWADNFDPIIVHLKPVDVTMVAISRAPFTKIAAYKERMGWSFRWLSSFETDFNYDFGVSFQPETNVFYNYKYQPTPEQEREGLSVFYRDEEGHIFHTYSAYARGIDLVNTAYNYLDLVPKGRTEEGRHPQYWIRRHDEYPA